MNILFIGSSSLLSLIPLHGLINSEYEVCAVAADAGYSEFDVINSGSIQSLAFTNSIPFINLNEKLSDVISQIKQYEPDVILVACYARLIPQSILTLAKVDGFNLHPSLLPRFRGPAPLFWQFQKGINDFGITIHSMDSKFDTGNIVLQKEVEMYDGISINDATRLLAHEGEAMILDLLHKLSNNTVCETAQNNSLSSYQSFPIENDYTISALWQAKRIYNFINACKESGILFLCEVGGNNYNLINALSYQDTAYECLDNETVVLDGDILTFSCQNSYIQCQIKID